jgi:phosphoketolase
VKKPGRRKPRPRASWGAFSRRDEAEPRQQELSLFSPDENNSNRWQDVLEVTTAPGWRTLDTTITSLRTGA